VTKSTFDDGVLSHPKMVEAGEDATDLWMRSVIYCNKYGLGGVIRTGAVRGFTSKPQRVVDQLIERLVSARLWDVEPGVGWRVHDFHDWNWTEEQRAARREEIGRKRSEAGRKGNEARWGGRSQSIANGSQTDRSDGSQVGVANSQDDRPPPAPSPSPSPEEKNPERAGVDVPPPRPAPRVLQPKAPVDEAPPADPRARAVFDAIMTDPLLKPPCTKRVADFATRVTAPNAFPGVNVLGQVLRAATWNAGQTKPKRDGRAFLLGWLGRSDSEAPSPLASGVIDITPPRQPSLPVQRVIGVPVVNPASREDVRAALAEVRALAAAKSFPDNDPQGAAHASR